MILPRAKKFSGLILPYYLLCLQIYSLYRIFTSLVGRSTYLNESVSSSSNSSIIKLNFTHEKSVQFEPPTQLILIVIDALRPDFINEVNTPFIWSKLKRPLEPDSSQQESSSYAVMHNVRVRSPTVTLPRIKSMMTGTIPSYQDFITNFHSSKLDQDNLLWKFKQYNKSICFYGDDTWLKLFGEEEFFTRFEGVSSFFVTDFYEVDFNVTRNIHRELEIEPDLKCDAVILHYLGLDHIGHVHGLKSMHLINSKLLEMDGIVNDVDSNVKDALILICGDHGMANIGGHGGDSWEETHTAVIAIAKSDRFTKINHSVKNQTTNLVQQTDLAPTLALLLRLGIPGSSIGNIIPDILSLYLTPDQLLLSYYENSIHLLELAVRMELESVINAEELKSTLNRIIKQHQFYIDNKSSQFNSSETQNILTDYVELNEQLTEILSDHLGAERDILGLLLSILLLVQTVALAHSEVDWLTTFPSHISVFILCINLIGFYLMNLLSVEVSFIFLNCFLILKMYKLFNLPSYKYSLLISPMCMYFSSSLIEEEHYARYFLYTSVIFYQIFLNSSYKIQDNNSLLVLVLLLSHRLTSSINQTGQKWRELRDLSDAFVEYNLVEFIGCISVILLIILRRSKSTTWFKLNACFICVVKVFLFRNQGAKQTSSLFPVVRGPQISYFLILFNFLWEKYSQKSQANKQGKTYSTLFNTFLLLSLLLHKLDNYSVLLSLTLQIELLHWLLSRSNNCLKSNAKPSQNFNSNADSGSILFIWLAYACFFYQGNSNNIATIDVNAGYIGLESYNSEVIGLLIFFYTYSCPILVYTYVLFEDVYPVMKDKYYFLRDIVQVNGLEVLVYSLVMLIFRNHLFIWSVFVPKLLYLIGWSVFHLFVLSFYSINLITVNR